MVVIGTFNTIQLAPGEVVRCVTSWPAVSYFNIFNLGPCTLYYRDDADPSPTDSRSLTLPPMSADNLVQVPDGPTGLRFTSGPPCVEGFDEEPETRMTLRLVRG
jgi:hypothetical protein